MWQIAKINLRHNFPASFALAVLLLMLTPVLFGTANLDSQATAVPLEGFVSLAGIILLTPVFQPEQNPQVEEVVTSKYISNSIIHTIRITCSIFALLLLISIFAFYMSLNGCKVTLPLLLGTIASSVFLGSLGMLAAGITNNTAVSYMVPVVYYSLNFAGGSGFGNFYLFSMMHGEYGQKVWLFASGTGMILLSVFVKRLIVKSR